MTNIVGFISDFQTRTISSFDRAGSDKLIHDFRKKYVKFTEAIQLAKSYDYHHNDFDHDEISYLDRWLCENIELDMLKMLRGSEPINMKGD